MSSRTRPRRLSQSQIRELDIQIGFLEGLVRADSGFVEAWEVLGDAYTDRGQPAASLLVDEKLCRLRPQDAHLRFHFACSLAATGQLEKAAEALEMALDLGYRDVQWVSEEPQLEPLRKHPAFRRIRARLKNLKPAD
jgi:cytochrome c-type biogenesis protein CcmH/NrfG